MKRTHQLKLFIRVTKGEKETIQQKAFEAGLTVNALARVLLLRSRIKFIDVEESIERGLRNYGRTKGK